VLRNTVQVQHLVPHLECVARKADNALDVVLLGVVRWQEYNDFRALRVRETGKTRRGARKFSSINCFVYEEEVPYQQGALHGAGWNLESLYEKGADEKEQDDGCADHADSFPHPATCGHGASALGGIH